ncbi:MAG: DNA gyrase inhibitor YacG [Planctomycetota bacterium]|nr:DNA gyrase inhibitor YacG [Planctomycetota bacterium]
MSAVRVRCPICKQPVTEPPAPEAPRTFPFCGERCKLIDLGRWLDGKYQIPVKDTDEDEGPATSDEAR